MVFEYCLKGGRDRNNYRTVEGKRDQGSASRCGMGRKSLGWDEPIQPCAGAAFGVEQSTTLPTLFLRPWVT